MTKNLLQRARGLFLSAGLRKSTPVETRSPYFNDLEIASLKQQAKVGKDAAVAEQRRRGHKVNPRIVAARKSGASI